jgi:peptidyl-tRNA hydrolase, PTH1 family
MKLIVGLGNPGNLYKKTRHNVGFMILDTLNKTYGDGRWRTNKKFNADTSEITHNNEKFILAKPLTYMNASGQSIQMLMHFYKIEPKDIIIIHDEKDLPLGEFKIQKDRGHAGHNGIKSIIEHIGTKDFHRARIGIASKNEKKMNDTAKFVLGKFGIFEKHNIEKIYTNIIDSIFQTLS